MLIITRICLFGIYAWLLLGRSGLDIHTSTAPKIVLTLHAQGVCCTISSAEGLQTLFLPLRTSLCPTASAQWVSKERLKAERGMGFVWAQEKSLVRISGDESMRFDCTKLGKEVRSGTEGGLSDPPGLVPCWTQFSRASSVKSSPMHLFLTMLFLHLFSSLKKPTFLFYLFFEKTADPTEIQYAFTVFSCLHKEFHPP